MSNELFVNINTLKSDVESLKADLLQTKEKIESTKSILKELHERKLRLEGAIEVLSRRIHLEMGREQ